MSTLFIELYNRDTIEDKFGSKYLLDLLKDDPTYRVPYTKTVLPKDTMLCSEFTPNDNIYFLESGVVAYEYKEQIISFSSQGDIIGMDDIFSLRQNKDSVRTISSATVYIFPKQDVMKNLLRMQEGWLFLYLNNHNHNILIAHKYILMRQVGKLRLKKILRDFADKYGYKDGKNTKIPGYFTRKDLANYANLSTNSMSQICKHLEEEGFCSIKAKQFILLDYTMNE
ncbi:Crp/Fnr family transcriptional regulator [Listeria grandensis]|uniref:Crp/Fnr family transcriptional regulator n=1 Tax=Listeria grandensis TaxID=1494963 RepID=A0A7X1CPN0_9LIST|nr:Crp/Fnr family transcriptional regulator [Listeria grandensis]MBC1473837.1 Crp/Fnr family transcriptional regulator [Listeria grandensis]MBC1936146.1 Crp/Fnr family transcriptional regulator [Listeria grandensis]